MANQKKKYWLDDHRNVDKIFYILCGCCGLLFAADWFYHKHVQMEWEAWYGFYALYGFVACVSLVLIAKELRKILMRKEDYYDR